MSELLDPDRLAAWRAFLEAHAALLDVLGAELEQERRLPLAWYDVLVQLSEVPEGRLRMQELARSLLISKSGLTRLVDRMEKAGYVERQPCPADLRGTFAVLTPAGRSALREAAPVHLRGVQQYFTRHLSATEAETLRAAFTRIREATPPRG